MCKKDGIECELLVKCEFLNPGGSVKDRIGRRMIMDAEKTGRIQKGDILIEATSGNTGIGMAMSAAALGYNMIVTMPEKMSQEKQDALRGLGTTIVRTPTEYGFDHLDSHIGIAGALKEKLGARAHVLDQYKNPGNPMVHYQETAEEIWEQTDGQVDVVVAGTGTGGTICGIARRLKELNPNIQIVGVDPPGSILAQPMSINDANPGPEGGQQTEGVGYDFIPRVFDRTVIDHWIKGPDKESFIIARRMLAEEGLMCGGSSGGNMWAAMKYIKENNIGKGKKVVVICPDNIRNYMTKHLNNDWMYERDYITEKECMEKALPKYVDNLDWGQKLTIKDLKLKEAHFVTTKTTCQEAIDLFREKSFDQFPVKGDDGKGGQKTVGVLTAKNLMVRLGKSQLKLSDPISRAIVRDIRQVTMGMPLNEMTRVLTRNDFVLVDDKYFLQIQDIFDGMHAPKVQAPKKKPVFVEPEDLAAAQDKDSGNCKMMIGAMVGAGLGFAACMMMNKCK